VGMVPKFMSEKRGVLLVPLLRNLEATVKNKPMGYVFVQSPQRHSGKKKCDREVRMMRAQPEEGENESGDAIEDGYWNESAA
ncbi:MAG TPA: hypothetical protein VIV66_12595, partial [Pyrinomonadaceae bacterium]